MAQITTKGALISIIVLIVLVFVAQLIVGVFGTASAQVNKTLAQQNFISANGLFTASVGNAINDFGANALVLTLTGDYAWISVATPLTITVTGNAINTYATNVLYATATTSNSETFTITSPTSPQTLCATCGNYYNITALSSGGTADTYKSYPSITYTVAQNFESVTHNSAPQSFTTNTFSGSKSITISEGIALSQFAAAGSANTSVVNFIPIVILVCLIMIILALFGLRNILNVGAEAGEGTV